MIGDYPCVLSSGGSKCNPWPVNASHKASSPEGLPDLSHFEKQVLYDYLINCEVLVSQEWSGPLMKWKERCEK